MFQLACWNVSLLYIRNLKFGEFLWPMQKEKRPMRRRSFALLYCLSKVRSARTVLIMHILFVHIRVLRVCELANNDVHEHYSEFVKRRGAVLLNLRIRIWEAMRANVSAPRRVGAFRVPNSVRFACEYEYEYECAARSDWSCSCSKGATLAALWLRATRISAGYASDSAELGCHVQVRSEALAAFRAT